MHNFGPTKTLKTGKKGHGNKKREKIWKKKHSKKKKEVMGKKKRNYGKKLPKREKKINASPTFRAEAGTLVRATADITAAT